ncbi:MAG: tetratricopeptide repeat protein [Saprospiraceae bacterium]|nr:tetratricopeptide repeat protein [Saprospiraceae bacterium]
MQPIFQEHICLTEKELTAYLNGALEQQDRFRVENHLLDCPLCSDALEGFSLTLNQAPQKIKAISPKLRWLRAAAAVLVVAVCLLGLRVFLSNSDQQLYSAFFESYPNEMDKLVRSSTVEEETASIPENLVAAFKAYDAEEYEKSAAFFTTELNSNTYGAIARFYGGIAALEAGDNKKAEELLEAASQTGSIYEAEAKWYLALTLLREGRKDDALQLLNMLAADSSGRYFKKANTLRNKF